MQRGEVWFAATPDGVPTDCVVNFDNIHTIPRETLRRFVVQLDARRMAQGCQCLRDATGC